MSEIELKFLLDEAGRHALRTRLRGLPLVSEQSRTRALRSVYFDTDDLALKRARFSIRIRKDGRRWLQTVKTRAQLQSGLSRVDEFESPAPGGRLNIALVEDEGMRAALTGLIGDAPLKPVCETAMRRVSTILQLDDGTRAELALDSGEIIAGEASVPFSEAEIELIEGRVTGLFDLARLLFPDGRFRLSQLSKAERGFLLAEGGGIGTEPVIRKAKRVAFTREETAEEAAQRVLRECFEQIASNRDVALDRDDPKAPHQIRVGLRRLRSAFAVFREALGSPELNRLELEARWLGHEVGALRDLDVAIMDIIDPEQAAHPDEPSFAALRDVVVKKAALTRKSVRETLAGARTGAFLLDLAQFTETRGWLLPEDMDQSRRLAAPVSQVADQALEKCWSRVGKRAKGIRDLEIEARHDLRKELKQLRYAIEFLAPLYKKTKTAPFIRRLKQLQTIFGDLNDAAMVEALFSGPDAPGAASPQAQRASGWIIGTRRLKAETTWQDARELWSKLKEAPRFWQ